MAVLSLSLSLSLSLLQVLGSNRDLVAGCNGNDGREGTPRLSALGIAAGVIV